MRQKFIIGNWKMHTTSAEAGRLAKAIVDGVGTAARVSVAVFPPFPYLALVGEILKGSRVALGAQNLYPEKDGAFTGEASPTMLLDLGCKYVILGHSERREKLGETDGFINQKARFALAAGLDAIICVGETRDRAIGGTGHDATPRQAQEGHAVIRRRFGWMFGETPAQALAIQYGGSVKPENAAALPGRPGVDGALIGGASLQADQFLAIVRAGISAV